MLYSSSLFLAYNQSRRIFELENYPHSMARLIGAGAFTGQVASRIPFLLLFQALLLIIADTGSLYALSSECGEIIVLELNCRLCASFVESPVDLFKSKVQLQHGVNGGLYRGSVDCATSICRLYGLRGVYQVP